MFNFFVYYFVVFFVLDGNFVIRFVKVGNIVLGFEEGEVMGVGLGSCCCIFVVNV